MTKQLRWWTFAARNGGLIALLLLAAVLAIREPAFVSQENFKSIAFSVALLLPVAIGMQALLITGSFDLSVGSIAAIAAVIFSYALHSGSSLSMSLMVALSAGGLFGVFNGWLVAKLRLNAMLVTLASMGMIRALALALSDSKVIAGIGGDAEHYLRAEILGLPKLVYFMAGTVAVGEFAFRRQKYLRWFFAVGSSAEAADLCGIRVARVRILAFTFASVGAATCGVLQAARTSSASPLLFQSLPLDVISACVLGGASLRGGSGTIVGAACGLAAIVVLENAVVMLGASVYWKDFLLGIMLLGALVANRVSRKNS